MPKRKRMKDYGNKIPTDMSQRYINTWSNNQESPEDLKMISLLLKAEGGSLIQILISDEELYNGIFHLKKFKFIERNGKTRLVVSDLDDLHDSRFQNFKGLIRQLPEILEKYEGILESSTNIHKNPIEDYNKMPILIME